MSSYKIIFAGTPTFAAVHLEALINSGHSIKAVYTQPDRPYGRGRQLKASPVKTLALQHNLPVFQPTTLKDIEEQNKLKEFNADFMIVVAYGLLLPKNVLSIPKYGCINVHASLLPKWRGAAPIQRAILAGDTLTGITIMQMDAGLDTGNILYKDECKILSTDTTDTLQTRLATLGSKALLHTLQYWNEIKSELQNNSLSSYAHKIKKEEAEINWETPAIQLELQVRAFNPAPISFFYLDNNPIRIWEAEVIHNPQKNIPPGTIINISNLGIDVATSNDALRLKILQMPGGKALTAKDILNSRKEIFSVGKMLGVK